MYDRMQELYQFSHCSEPFFKHMEFCQNQDRFDDRLTALLSGRETVSKTKSAGRSSEVFSS